VAVNDLIKKCERWTGCQELRTGEPIVVMMDITSPLMMAIPWGEVVKIRAGEVNQVFDE
jgi:hypothetical protein